MTRAVQRPERPRLALERAVLHWKRAACRLSSTALGAFLLELAPNGLAA
jgi:hypothetical protein